MNSEWWLTYEWFSFLLRLRMYDWLSCASLIQSYFTTGGLPPIIPSWRQARWDPRPEFFIFQLNTCGYSPYVTSSLTRGWICRLQLLLVFPSAVILRSQSRETRDHVLLSHISDSPNMEGQVHVFISPINTVVRLYYQALVVLCILKCSPFISSGRTE
jgi:hypothetical protein